MRLFKNSAFVKVASFLIVLIVTAVTILFPFLKLSGKALASNVLSQAVVGTITSGVTAKAFSAFKLVPNNVGRPISVNASRGLAESFKGNSLNAIHKQTTPGLISTNSNILFNSIMTVFKNNNTNKHRTRK